MATETISFRIDDVRWGCGHHGIPTIRAIGRLFWNEGRKECGFEADAVAMGRGNKGLYDLRLVERRYRIPGKFRRAELRRPIVDCLTRVLNTVNMWAGEQQERGATAVMNQKVIPEEAKGRFLFVYRFGVLDLTPPPWEQMWSRIKSRLRYDSALVLHGFSKRQFDQAILSLEQVFPNGWARKRHLVDGKQLTMGEDLPRATRGWFPAYQLAHLAIGGICYDPGLNYLAEIGCALQELDGFAGLPTIRRQLARNPGILHQVSFAGDIYRRGRLVALEPGTGSGSAKGDLLVSLRGGTVDVEMKTLTSNKPDRKLAQEVRDKAKKLPSHPQRPVVIYAMQVDGSGYDKECRERFTRSARQLAQTAPPNISAIVAGETFVDARGGRVKRVLDSVGINPRAVKPAVESDLRELFTSNCEDVLYPTFSVGSFMAYGRSADETQV